MSWKVVSFFLFFVYIPFTFCKEVRILSLDGGGIRGVASLELLKNLEQDTGVSLKSLISLREHLLALSLL